MTTQPEVSVRNKYLLPAHPLRGSHLAASAVVAFQHTRKERMQRWHYRLERLFARQAY